MLEFFAGEKQYVEVTVKAKKTNEIAVVNSALYELINCKDEKTVDGGNCEIESNKLKILLDLVESGTYKLIVTARIGVEIIKSNTIVKVGA